VPSFRNRDDRWIWEDAYTLNYWGVPAQFMPGEIALDCGGHIGSVAVLAAERGATVVTVEPASSNLHMLAINTQHLGGHVRIIPAAVVARGGPKQIRLVHCPVEGGFSGHTTVLHPDRGSHEDVATVEFDKLVCRPIRYCKLNIEGAEYEILRRCEVLDRIQAIAVQFHRVGGEDPEQGRELLKKAGFRELRWLPNPSQLPPYTMNFWDFWGTRL
jgi:FkbM family methyltransferase